MKRLIFLALLLAGCAAEPEPPTAEPATSDRARPSDAVIAERVAEATARLEATEGGRLVLAAIDAHGGLERWYANGPVHFRYRYERLTGDDPIDTEQTVDTWSARARHLMNPDSSVPDSSAAFGWTGEEAWVIGTDSLPTNARFWSLTPYYFVAMPFVLADPGVNLEAAGQMTAEGETYDLVRATFEAGTGDAPDDYYFLLLDPETREVGGVRYVVSYPGFFPEGGSTPERLMLYDGAQTASGIVLQEGFRSFAWTGDGTGEAAARGTVTDLEFLPDAPASLFAMPPDARVQEAM
ncbi:MAG: hypothetical protein AAGI91_11170 [Bacteroidota bacterium]